MSKIAALSDYIKAVTKNITLDNKLDIDIVVSGGAFNGVIALGSIMLIKQLEIEGKLKVHKLSGCSAGAPIIITYLANSFDKIENIFQRLKNSFKVNGNLSDLHNILKDWVYNIFDSDEEMKQVLNGKCYISYNDIANCEFCTIDKYDNRDHLITCLFRSSFIPILIDGNTKVEDTYIDGIVPYIFKDSKNDVLYMELINDKVEIIRSLITKNEENEHYRVLKGVTDAAEFFTENKSGRLSWYKNWDVIKITKNNLYYLTCMIICIFVDFLSSFNIPTLINENKVMQLVKTCLIKSMKDIISVLNN